MLDAYTCSSSFTHIYIIYTETKMACILRNVADLKLNGGESQPSQGRLVLQKLVQQRPVPVPDPDGRGRDEL